MKTVPESSQGGELEMEETSEGHSLWIEYVRERKVDEPGCSKGIPTRDRDGRGGFVPPGV